MTNVLVTSVGGRSVGFHIMRSLLLYPETYNLVVTDMNPNAAGLYYGPPGYVIPACTRPNYLESLINIITKHKIDIVIPGSEPELYALSEIREDIENYTKLLINPKPVIDICKDKVNLYSWLGQHEYDCPKTSDYDNINYLLETCNFPLVAKPTKKTGGSRGVQLIEDYTELESYVETHGKVDIIFQEYVGTPYDEYTVAVVVYKNGNTDSCVLHRILDDISLNDVRYIDGEFYATSTGLSQVISIRSGVINLFCERLAKDIGIIGPCNIQFRLEYNHKEGPKFKIFEVHPRFSGTAYMRASIKFNDVAALTANFVDGIDFPKMDYETNMVMLKYLDHVIVPEVWRK